MNPLIDKTRQALMAKVDKRLAPVVAKVVESGKRVMYSDETRQMAMQELKKATDPEGIGSAVSKLAAVLFSESKQTIPPNVLFPATMQLMLEALEFLEEAGAVKVDNDFLAACTEATGSAFLQMLGVTPEKLQEMSQQQPPAQPGIVAGQMGA